MQAFATDINSPLKPPTQNKEGHQQSVNGRKGSVSQGSGAAYGVASPSSTQRPSTRRRETGDSNPFGAGGLGSPTSTRFARDDQPAWLSRRGDGKDGEPEDVGNDSTKPVTGNLIRSNTGGSAVLGSMWPPSSASASGGFGNFSIGASSSNTDRRAGAGASGSRLAHLIPKDGADGTKSVESQQSQSSWRTRPRTDTDPFGDAELSGSAILGGSQDIGLAANRAGTLGTPIKGSAEDFGMSGLNMKDNDDPNSPAETNPYRSPHADRYEQDSSIADKSQGSGQAEQSAMFSNNLPRAFGGGAFDGSDRSQTSSVGAKAYPLGTFSGWPAPAPTGTPDRERPNFGNAFGNALFGNVGDLQSPALGGLGNVFGPTGSAGLGAGSIGRGSKLGSLFPPAMQAQMQAHDHESADGADLRHNNSLGAIGRGGLGGPARETDSPMRSGRGVFDELFPTSEASRSHGFPGDATPGGTIPQSFTPVSGGMPFGGAHAEPAPGQIRQMVMPDRMRWVYLDPQGQVQGPFTGLEMNDWYKANFFTPDLRVKKVEDKEFEPLGQLIRRIGNSREPFLVPQIGVPHGPPSQNGPFTANTGAGVVPPLSGVFPSFGRTLTADEQNNLERRKQEEQYMMAQQRDYVMRHQAINKFGPGLQSHSSAHSLQSQTSFGSMNNPIGMPPQPHAIGSNMAPGSFGEHGAQGGARAAAGNGELFRQDELANLSAPERQMLANLEDAANPTGSDRSDLPRPSELAEDGEGFKDRLQEFEGLRAQHDAEQVADAVAEENQNQQTAHKISTKGAGDDSLSLTEQVQITQAAAASAPEMPGMPMPFPPPSSTTPLPAPTAQRARSNLPEQFSRSQSATPEVVQPPPMAPWAKDMGNDGPKGPSLKEIQEAEARKAAKAEEHAAAIRKAAMEHEDALQRERERVAAAAANAAALPASSTWGHGSPASTGTPWAKPSASKGVSTGPVASPGPKGKTLAEIQREEEVRKQKARDIAIQTGAPLPGSKSFVSLAAKATNNATGPGAMAPPPGAGWATVGAGGKVKSPASPATPTRASVPAPVKPAVLPAAKANPKPTMALSQTSTASAIDEFNKWVQRELSRGITGIADSK